jgi:hypothetical protein
LNTYNLIVFDIFASKHTIMKYSLLSLTILTLGLISCGDDDTTPNSNNTAAYFPLSSNSSWSYTNESEDQNSQDNMFVVGTQQENGVQYTNLDTQELNSGGFMVALLTQNLVRNDTGKLIVNGTFGGVPIEGFPDISIPLNNAVLFDPNALNGTQLNIITGSFEQTIMDFPIIIEYTSITTQEQVLPSYTTDTQTYTDVIQSNIVLNLEISTEVQVGGTTLSLPILSSQDVLVVENYYAANIGLVFSKETVDYALEDLSGIPGLEIPLPEQNTSISTATLTSFEIGN